MIERTLSPARARLAAALMFAAMLLAGIHGPAEAKNFENLDRIDALVATSMGAAQGQPGGAVAPIDRRLRLAPCPQLPQIDGPRMNAATVSCPSLGWRIRVPLLSENSTSSQNVAVASSEPVIKKGDPVQLVAGNGSFSISRLMVADEDGAVGAMIRVREEPRATPVMAQVERNGVVRIPGI